MFRGSVGKQHVNTRGGFVFDASDNLLYTTLACGPGSVNRVTQVARHVPRLIHAISLIDIDCRSRCGS